MKSRVFENLGLKLVSLVIGFSLWYIVAGEQGAEIVFSIPLELWNLPAGLEVVEESVQQAEVRLRGSAEILRTLSAQDIQVRMDMSDVKPGDQVFYLKPEQVTVPFGVRVMRVSPASVRLELDRTAQREVQVVPRVVGSPSAGFELLNLRLEPQEIEVSGPASHLESLEQITTEPISAEGLRETYSQSVQVRIEDPYIRVVNLSRVEVTLEVGEERLRRQLSGVPLTSHPASVKAKLSPSAVKVQVEGPRSLVEQLQPGDLEGQVTVGGLSPGVHRLRPQVWFRRPGFSVVAIVSTEPEEVRVRILESGT
ncbi:MAG: YbbR-like domain-containing protein [Acidobacteriota bacterium]